MLLAVASVRWCYWLDDILQNRWREGSVSEGVHILLKPVPSITRPNPHPVPQAGDRGDEMSWLVAREDSWNDWLTAHEGEGGGKGRGCRRRWLMEGSKRPSPKRQRSLAEHFAVDIPHTGGPVLSTSWRHPVHVEQRVSTSLQRGTAPVAGLHVTLLDAVRLHKVERKLEG